VIFLLTHLLEARDVCSISFNYGLTSLFIQRDSSLQRAQDEAELCQLCGQIVRLGFLYANLPQSRSKWAATLADNACSYAISSRLSDCQKLTEAIIDAEEDFFMGQTTRFSSDDLELSRTELSHLLEWKSDSVCSSIRCCAKKKNIKPGQEDDSILQPEPLPEIPATGEIRSELRNLNQQRFTLQQEKEALDQVKTSFELTKTKVLEQKHQVELHEDELNNREGDLATNQQVLINEKKGLKANRSQLVAKEKELNEWEKDLEKLENELEKDEARIKQQKQQLATTTTGNKPTVVKTNSDQVNKEKKCRYSENSQCDHLL